MLIALACGRLASVMLRGPNRNDVSYRNDDGVLGPLLRAVREALKHGQPSVANEKRTSTTAWNPGQFEECAAARKVTWFDDGRVGWHIYVGKETYARELDCADAGAA